MSIIAKLQLAIDRLSRSLGLPNLFDRDVCSKTEVNVLDPGSGPPSRKQDIIN